MSELEEKHPMRGKAPPIKGTKIRRQLAAAGMRRKHEERWAAVVNLACLGILNPDGSFKKFS